MTASPPNPLPSRAAFPTRPRQGHFLGSAVFVGWTARGIEYPVLLGFVDLVFAFGGGGALSLYRKLGKEL